MAFVRWRPLRALPLATVAVLVALAASACGTDVTRQRVEDDVRISFVHAFLLSDDLQGVPADAPRVVRIVCHSATNVDADSGPGPWVCTISYGLDGKPLTATLGVTVDSLGCYAAADVQHPSSTILDRYTHDRIVDPKVGFDGCFDTQDDRTGTGNGPNGP